MTTFALISEGLTDQIILERIIDQLCDDVLDGGVYINPLQPLRDATDKFTAPHAGWELVFEYCKQRVGFALEANDYVVVHLDTDEGDHPNFGLSLTDGGVERNYEALVEGAINIIKSKIGDEILVDNIDRFLFAISVHSMESWLLLYLFDINQTKNCFVRLNKELKKSNGQVIIKTEKSYHLISKCIKKKRLAELASSKSSLGLFLERITRVSES